MIHVKKYHKGEPFKTIGALIEEVLKGGWVFYNHKPYHPSFIRGFPLSTFINGIPGRFFKAMKAEGKR